MVRGNSRSFEKRLAHHRDDSDDIKNWGVEDIVLPGDSKQDWDAMLDALYDSDSCVSTSAFGIICLTTI